MTEQLKPKTAVETTTTSLEEPEFVDTSAYDLYMKSLNEGVSPAEREEAAQKEARRIKDLQAEYEKKIYFDLEYQLLEDPRPRKWRGRAMSLGEFPCEAISNFASCYAACHGTVIAVRVVMPESEAEEEEICRRHGFTRSFTKAKE